MTTIIRTRTPAQDARWEHLYRLLVHEQPERADERTEADDTAWRWACMLRNQEHDDRLLYNEQGGDYRDVGY